MITESDRILMELEHHFGPLGEPIARLTPQRQLERTLFRAWCDWLCRLGLGLGLGLGLELGLELGLGLGLGVGLG